MIVVNKIAVVYDGAAAAAAAAVRRVGGPEARSITDISRLEKLPSNSPEITIIRSFFFIIVF